MMLQGSMSIKTTSETPLVKLLSKLIFCPSARQIIELKLYYL